MRFLIFSILFRFPVKGPQVWVLRENMDSSI